MKITTLQVQAKDVPVDTFIYLPKKRLFLFVDNIVHHENKLEFVFELDHEQEIVKKFNYKYSDNPRVISYMYGSVMVVRPITFVNNYGKLIQKYESGIINIADTQLEKDILNGKDLYDEDVITDEDFENKIIDKQIINVVI